MKAKTHIYTILFLTLLLAILQYIEFINIYTLSFMSVFRFALIHILVLLACDIATKLQLPNLYPYLAFLVPYLLTVGETEAIYTDLCLSLFVFISLLPLLLQLSTLIDKRLLSRFSGHKNH